LDQLNTLTIDNCKLFESTISTILATNQKNVEKSQKVASSSNFTIILNRVVMIVFMFLIIRAYLWEPQFIEDLLGMQRSEFNFRKDIIP
jgi:hypothetical protein